MTTNTNTRRSRKNLTTALACLLALGTTTLPTLAQGAGPAPDLLTVVGGWEKAETLNHEAAVEGLAVEIRSDLLDSATQSFRFQSFDGQVHEAHLERFERTAIGGSLWVGRVAGYGEHSKVLLAQIEGFVSGYLDTPEARYEITPRPGGHVMLKLDPSRYRGCATGSGDAEDGEGEEGHEHTVPAELFDQTAQIIGLDPQALRAKAAEKSADKSTAMIDIVVAFSNTAAQTLGGHLAAGATASSAVASLDDAFINSGIAARASLNAWACLGSSTLGDTSGGNDGLVLALYSDNSSFSNDYDKRWHQARAEFGQTANSYDSYGEELAVGDFNNDDYADLAIGIPGETVNGKSDAGAVRILYGSSDRLTSTGTDFLHQDVSGVNGVVESGDQFGHTLATGDFDGDGYDDLAVGNPYEDIGSTADAGLVNILYGASGGITTSGDQSFHLADIGGTSQSGDRLGYALASGDFDSDGYDDLVISIPWLELGATDSGMLFVIFGSSNGLNFSRREELSQIPKLNTGENPENGDLFGYSLAAGDFNNDGYDDLVVGVPYEDVDGQGNAGVVHVFFSSPWGFFTPFSQPETFEQGDFSGGTESNDYFGWALAVGDLDGDGLDDLAISAPYEDSNDRGRVHVLRGTSSGMVSAGYYFSGSGSGDQLGYALAIADFNADGYDDLAMGKPGADIGDSNAGSVSIRYGGSGIPTNGGTWHHDSPDIAGKTEANDSFGAALAAGDFDDDGDFDLAVGVPGKGVSSNSRYFLKWLSGSNTISSLRDNHDADLVGLIVENMTNANGAAIKTLDTTDGDSSVYYQVTQRNSVLGNFAFAHEMGHLIGLYHDPETTADQEAWDAGACTTSGGTEYARGHRVPGEKRSIMAYGCPSGSNCPADPLFSNPNVDFSFGEPSGIADERDNARCANLTVGKVADYRPVQP